MNFDARGDSQERTQHTDGKVRMPFGKHKGKTLDEIPGDYLMWVLDNTNLDNRPTLKEAIRARLGLAPTGKASTSGSDLEASIKVWFRGLALDFHPDRRGSTEGMIAINEAHHRLRKILKL